MVDLKAIQTRRVIQVFEYQRITVGEQIGEACFQSADFEAMCGFVSKHGEKYFQVLHQSIRFRQYVGVIQVGTLTIEVLPKADRVGEDGATKNWQGVLLGMLRVCRFIKPELSPGARIGLQRHMLFDLYIELFFDEVEQVLRQGLLRQYQAFKGPEKVLKGRIDFPAQMRKHPLQKDKFFCHHDVYTFQHPLNQLIGQALYALKTLILPLHLQIRLSNMLPFFSRVNTAEKVSERAWETLRYNRKTERYRHAIDFAFLILLNYSPDIKSGRYPMVALLFDMNLLFEEYVYQKLIGAGVKGLEVRRQERTPFWHRRHLQPDLILTYNNTRIVLDTKWKILKHPQPDIEDLRQLYVYARFFGADKTILLFPQVMPFLEDFPETPFALSEEGSKRITCKLCFVPILKQNSLNNHLGKEVLEKIGLEIS